MAGEQGMLERRRIEAEIVKPIYAILARELGEEKARGIIAEAIDAAAREAGRQAAAAVDKASLETFIELFPLWTRGGALEIDVRRQDPGHFDFDVRRCRYAEMYREIGLGDELGVLLSCNRDAAFIEGYAPGVRLSRGGTIMLGNAVCDFRYSDPKAAEGNAP